MFWFLLIFLFLILYLSVFLFKPALPLGLVVTLPSLSPIHETWVEHYRAQGVDQIIILYTSCPIHDSFLSNPLIQYYQMESHDFHGKIQSFHKKFKWVLIVPTLQTYVTVSQYPSLRDYLHKLEYTQPIKKAFRMRKSNSFLFQTSSFYYRNSQLERITNHSLPIFDSDEIKVSSMPEHEIESDSTLTRLDLVMTRYKESLDFIDRYPFIFDAFDSIFIYNKGKDSFPPIQRKQVYVISVPNVGDGEETIFRFIIEHYHEKDRIVLFSSASMFCYPYDVKLKHFLFTLDRCRKTKDSILIIYPHDRSKTQHYEMKQYRQIGLENEEKHSKTLTRCLYHPLHVWFQKVLQMPFQTMEYISYYSIFAIHVHDWRHRPLSFYQTIHQRLLRSRYQEENHYLERTWAYLFQLSPHQLLFLEKTYLTFPPFHIPELLLC